MQGPVAQAAQTYNVVAITNISAMCTEYEQLASDIQGAQGGAQGFKKALPANMLQAKIARKGQLEPIIKHQLDTDIDLIHRNYVRYTQAVETMRTMAKQRLEHAKAAVALYQKSKKTNDLETAVHETASVGRDIQLLLETAQQDGKNFGKSWFDYRGFNPSASAPSLPHTVTDDFLASRTEMINDSKLVSARLKKFEEMVPQAQALNKMSATLAAGGRQDANTAFAHANKLTEKIDAEVQIILNGGAGFKQSWHFTKAKYDGLHLDATTLTKNKKTDLKNAEDRYSDAIAAVKVLKGKIKSTKVILDAEVKSFTKEESALGGVKAQLKHAQDEFAKLNPIVSQIATAEAQGLKDITAMRKRCTQ